MSQKADAVLLLAKGIVTRMGRDAGFKRLGELLPANRARPAPLERVRRGL